MNALEPSSPLSAGVRAANLLAQACQATDALRFEVVRELALQIGRQLNALVSLVGEEAVPDVLAEAAICCADLANLAACNAPDLPSDATPRAVEAARLAARAVEALGPMVESRSGDPGSGDLIRDVRSAAWRAGFAARLLDEAAERRSLG